MNISFLPPKHGLIGHRGLAGFAPENTISSIKAAHHYGLNTVEFDVQLSKDGQLIIFHDHELSRTSNGKGFIYEQEYSTLQHLDAGSWYDRNYANEKIPNLETNLPDILKYDLQYNIELKCPNNATEAYMHTLCERLCALIQKKWPANRALPLISSFEWELLIEVRKIINEVPVGFLCEVITPELIHLAAATQNASINCHYRALDLTTITRINHLNIPIMAYTVNDKPTANQLLNQGVFAVFTDSLTESSPNVRKAI